MKLEVNDLIHSTDRYRKTNEKWVAKPLLVPTGIQTADLQDRKPPRIFVFAVRVDALGGAGI